MHTYNALEHTQLLRRTYVYTDGLAHAVHARLAGIHTPTAFKLANTLMSVRADHMPTFYRYAAVRFCIIKHSSST